MRMQGPNPNPPPTAPPARGPDPSRPPPITEPPAPIPIPRPEPPRTPIDDPPPAAARCRTFVSEQVGRVGATVLTALLLAVTPAAALAQMSYSVAAPSPSHAAALGDQPIEDRAPGMAALRWLGGLGPVQAAPKPLRADPPAAGE